jgi:hypothetical protein
MPTDTFRTEYGTMGQREVKSDSDIAAAQDRARLSSTAGSGLGSKGKSLTGAPKQEPGESPSAFGDRMRKWRETETQRKAFGGK